MAAGVAALALATFAAGWRMAHRPEGRRAESTRELPGAGERVRLEVLNASGVAGLSRVATQRLRDRGLDVVYFGTDSISTLDSTEILVRQGDAAMGTRVQRTLGVGTVRAAPDPSRLLDVSVRLGRDYAARIGYP